MQYDCATKQDRMPATAADATHITNCMQDNVKENFFSYMEYICLTNQGKLYKIYTNAIQNQLNLKAS